MMSHKISFGLSVLLMTFILTLPTLAQDGNGLVIEGNPGGTASIGSLNPLRCDNAACRRITDFLFPTLFAIDPATGLLVGASGENYGLALDVQAPESETYTLTLRDDLAWSDGTPITAYDVFYSFLAASNANISSTYAPALRATISAAMVIDDHTIEFDLLQPNCATLTRMNFPVVPAHVFDPDFAATVTSFSASGDLEARYEAWQDVYPSELSGVMVNHSFDTHPQPTAGSFTFATIRPGQDIRLSTADGAQAFVYANVPADISALDFFLNGGSNVLVNPPLERRDDIKTTHDVQITEFPGSVWDFIAFNTADPARPQPAVGIDGKILEQGQHPLFGDARVRHAIQMAINVITLIDAALLGYGTPIAANRIPGTWAHNDNLVPSAYDPRGAEQLLESIGWKDADRDGVRECRGCLYGREGQALSFDLMVMQNGRREIAAELIAQQLRGIGVYANIRVMDPGSVLTEAQGQRFDAYMGGRVQRFPADPDQTGLFTRVGDVVDTGSNAGSYYNPEVDELMNKALTLPGCAPDARAAIYAEIQAILQQDQPYVWLYAQNEMIVASGGVQGFNPLPNQPFWNIRDWIVVQ
jgi:peptide/nickel transport system substrate-binding protein